MKQQQPFIPQLDSCRFFAVLLVMISHWIPGSLLNKVPNGFVGVTFFFVLSGYLISGKLLQTRLLVEAGSIKHGRALAVFFYKRSLRIFPLYFFVIVLLFILNNAIFNGNFWWYATYTANFLMFREQSWAGMLSHFWSLAVEEQFYLLWPLIIFFINIRVLKYIFPLIILMSVMFKFFTAHHNPFFGILPVSCFDAFGVGSLLAYTVAHSRYHPLLQERRRNSILTAAALLLSIIVFQLGVSCLFGVSIAILSAMIIVQCRLQVKGFVGHILNFKLFMYLGKISYGLYLYHNLMPWLIRCMTGAETRYAIAYFKLPFSIPSGAMWVLIMQAVMLILISSISWYVLEKPFNNLKRLYQ